MGSGHIFKIFLEIVAESKAFELVSLSTPVSFCWIIPTRPLKWFLAANSSGFVQKLRKKKKVLKIKGCKKSNLK
jgi:hypothetical protein